MSQIKIIAREYFPNVNEVAYDKVIISHEVRKLCKQNTCGNYGKNWMCPPAVASIDEFKEKVAQYDRFIVLHQVYPVESSLDWKGMMFGARNFKETLMKMKKKLNKELPRTKLLVLGAGSCNVCEECSYVGGKPFRSPKDAIVSLEACGIDVMGLMKDNGLKYCNGKNTITYIGGVMFADGVA